MIDVIIPVILGSCAVGFALMAWRSHNKSIVDGRAINTKRLLAMTPPYDPPEAYPLRETYIRVVEPSDGPVPVRERK